MNEPSKITLREALDRGKLDQFLAERQDQEPADCEAFEATLNSMAGRLKSEPETSPPDCADD